MNKARIVGPRYVKRDKTIVLQTLPSVLAAKGRCQITLFVPPHGVSIETMNTKLHSRRSCTQTDLHDLQGVDLRGLEPGLGVRAAHRYIRTMVPKLDGDRTLHSDMAAVRGLLADGTLQARVDGVMSFLL